MTEPDLWRRFRAATPARIALGRSGDALPTRALLDLQLAHARARDAVHAAVDFAALAAALAPRSVLRVESAAGDRATYLRRPDLGRRLDERSVTLLSQAGASDSDVAFIIADGLSAAAVARHAVPTLLACLDLLPRRRIAPIVLAGQARVAIGDEIGALLQAKSSVVLVGERPGLSVADSLGLYVTWDPRHGRKDSERNCVSNVHAGGLSYREAAEKIAWLLSEAARQGATGVQLKENATSAELPTVDRGVGTERLDSRR
jgi:ethanolamine ammonia-lyase small subunit